MTNLSGIVTHNNAQPPKENSEPQRLHIWGGTRIEPRSKPHPHERVAWYPLFVQARNFPKILGNHELPCDIRV